MQWQEADRGDARLVARVTAEIAQIADLRTVSVRSRVSRENDTARRALGDTRSKLEQTPRAATLAKRDAEGWGALRVGA
jgi:hypothetical protein